MTIGSVLARLGAGALVMAGLCACHSSTATPPADAAPPTDAAPDTDATPTAATCTITPPVPSDWRLVADGTSFRDSLGRVVFLRGVDGGGRSKFAPYVPFDFPDGGYQPTLDGYIAHAASWGIDVMRVPFTWAALEPTQGTDDANWLAMYDALLDAAWAQGIWTVLDFHQDLYSEVLCGDGFPGWTVPDAGPPHHDCANWGLEYFNNPDVIAAFDRFWDGGAIEGTDAGPIQPAYLAAWDVMVARYKDKPGVLGFEPINEPSGGSAAQASASETTFEQATLTSFYSTLVTHMRAEAPTSLVFIDPPGASGATLSTAMGKPMGDGIVFAPHYYPLSSAIADPQADLVAWQMIGQTWNVPVFLGEFGTSNQADVVYIESVFDALDSLSMSGSEWEYSVAAEEWNFETFGLVAADGGEFPIAQAVQRPYARAVAGSAITQTFLPAAEDDGGAGNAFNLTFTPTTGVTEVAIPASLYPTGYDIALSGACVDATSAPGRLLLQAAAGASTVSLTITPK